MVAGNPAPPQYRSIPNPKRQRIERFLIHDGQIHANLRHDGKEVVSRWNATAGAYEAVTPGSLLAAGGPRLGPAGANWRLPYYGRAAMVQGGSAYADNSCDGAVCQVVAHVARLNYALDFQQAPENNEGNSTSAVEAGTV